MTLLFIFASLGLQTTHFTHGKNNDVTNFLPCDTTPIFQCQTLYQTWDITPPSPSLPYLENIENRSPYKVLKMEICLTHAEAAIQRCSS